MQRSFVFVALFLCFAAVASAKGQAAQSAGGPAQGDSKNAKETAKSANPSAATPSSGTPAGTPNNAASPAKSSASQNADSKPKAETVWVNTVTGVYHRKGSRWYGKTKKGKYMTEADAIRAGYKLAGTE